LDGRRGEKKSTYPYEAQFTLSNERRGWGSRTKFMWDKGQNSGVEEKRTEKGGDGREKDPCQ